MINFCPGKGDKVKVYKEEGETVVETENMADPKQEDQEDNNDNEDKDWNLRVLNENSKSQRSLRCDNCVFRVTFNIVIKKHRKLAY